MNFHVPIRNDLPQPLIATVFLDSTTTKEKKRQLKPKAFELQIKDEASSCHWAVYFSAQFLSAINYKV
jgi:hypothetical protein